MEDVGKNVKIKLISAILPTDGEVETYEMWLSGSFIEKLGKTYLRYNEVLDDKTIQTTVKMNSENAFIMRSGGVKMRLSFNTVQKERGHYETQLGAIPIVTKTHKLLHEHSQEDIISGKFNVQYDLIIGGQSVGKYTLELTYSEGQTWAQ